MGACCTRQNILKDEILEFYTNTNEEDNSPDLYKNYNLNNTSKLFDNNNYNKYLNTIIVKIKEKYSFNEIKKITFFEIYNITIYYKDNYLNSNYLIYDLRNYEERKENFIKKMKQINYSYVEIQSLNNKKLQKFIKFITNKNIIFIVKDIEKNNNNNNDNNDKNNNDKNDNNNENINKKEENNNNNNNNNNNDNNNIINNIIKGEISDNSIININKKKSTNEIDPINIISLLYDFNINFTIMLLNTSFNKKILTNFTLKLSQFLEDNHKYENLPYILLSFSHIEPLKNEGFFFISFNKENLFDFNYFENFNNNNNENNNNNNDINKEFIKNFMDEIKITTIIQIDNKISKSNFKQFQKGNFLYKEYSLSMFDVNQNKDNVEMICRWLRKEMILGHSIILNIKNYKENDDDNNDYNNNDNNENNNDNNDNNNKINENDNYIIIVILILCLTTKIDMNKIIEYLKEKVIFIKNFKEKIDFLINSNNNKNINNKNFDISKLINNYDLNNNLN